MSGLTHAQLSLHFQNRARVGELHGVAVEDDQQAAGFHGLLETLGVPLLDAAEGGGKGRVAVLHAAEPVRRTVSESIALAKAHEEETGKLTLGMKQKKGTAQ